MMLLNSFSSLATLTLVVTLIVPQGLTAQTAGLSGGAHLGAAELRALTDSLSALAARQPGRQVPGRPLHRDSTVSMFLLRRDTSSRPEIHDHVTEIFVLQTGRAVVISGGRAEGAGPMEPGEWNGGQIVPDKTDGAEIRPIVRRAVGPGDIVMMPARVPHQIVVESGGSVTYLVIKIRAGS